MKGEMKVQFLSCHRRASLNRTHPPDVIAISLRRGKIKGNVSRVKYLITGTNFFALLSRFILYNLLARENSIILSFLFLVLLKLHNKLMTRSNQIKNSYTKNQIISLLYNKTMLL